MRPEHPGHRHDRKGRRRKILHGLLPHQHSHSVDHAQLSHERGRRTAVLSFIVLVATASAQAVVVAVSGSVALLGDTLHNFTDALTALPLWIAFSLSTKKPTSRYTHGFGRAEDIAGILILLLIAASAITVVHESIDRLLNPQEVKNLELVIVASIIGFIGNEAVAIYRIRVGRSIGSAALVADGAHARVDGLTSVGVLVGALAVAAGMPLADPIVGILISITIFGILIGAGRDVYHRLMDAVDPDLSEDVRAALLDVGGVQAVGTIRVRWVGHRLRVDAEIGADPDLPLLDAHAIAVRAEHHLLHKIPHLDSALIHVDPTGDSAADAHQEIAHHFR